MGNLRVKIMNVKKIQKELNDFAKKRDWKKFHNLKNLAISISIESSELLEIFQWHRNEDIDEKIKKQDSKKKFQRRLLMSYYTFLDFLKLQNLI